MERKVESFPYFLSTLRFYWALGLRLFNLEFSLNKRRRKITEKQLQFFLFDPFALGISRYGIWGIPKSRAVMIEEVLILTRFV